MKLPVQRTTSSLATVDATRDQAADLLIAGIVAAHDVQAVVVVGPAGTEVPAPLQPLEPLCVDALSSPQLSAWDPPAGHVLVVVAAAAPSSELAALLQDLLDSPLTDRAILLIEGAGEPDRRAVIDAVHVAAWAKVTHLDLDLLPARMRTPGEARYELVGGLGLVWLDAETAAAGQDPRVGDVYPTAHLLRRGRDALAGLDDGPPELPAVREDLREEHLLALRATVDPLRLRTEADLRHLEREHRRLLALYLSVVNSTSWRITAPLRAILARLSRGR